MASLAQAKHLRAKYLLMAREAYGEALRLLHQALSFSSEATSPAVLATICLLWKFDVCTFDDLLITLPQVDSRYKSLELTMRLTMILCLDHHGRRPLHTCRQKSAPTRSARSSPHTVLLFSSHLHY
jgi:hypothetical protein